jgi:hypothetical protein
MWNICQVGTARVTGDMYSHIEGSTHSFPITSRDFVKEEHEGSTLQFVRLQVARSVKGKLDYHIPRFRRKRDRELNALIREIVSCERHLC